ncbi:MAG: hypothetical protein H7Z38_21660 [Rubrivivax sp.]|nr:hypothetical protein [Pyrinomonadaceae bacterium]
MGSSNSTKWEGTATRACVESCFTITAPRSAHAKGQHARAWWPRSGVSVSCEMLSGGASPLLELRHDYGGGGAQLVSLASMPVNLGGRRWWFLCPGCGARVRALHLLARSWASREFKCRGCHNLTYESAQSSRGSSRAFFLLRAAQFGCSYREARDSFRRGSLKLGAVLYEPRRLRFEGGEAQAETITAKARSAEQSNGGTR